MVLQPSRHKLAFDEEEQYRRLAKAVVCRAIRDIQNHDAFDPLYLDAVYWLRSIHADTFLSACGISHEAIEKWLNGRRASERGQGAREMVEAV